MQFRLQCVPQKPFLRPSLISAHQGNYVNPRGSAKTRGARNVRNAAVERLLSDSANDSHGHKVPIRLRQCAAARQSGGRRRRSSESLRLDHLLDDFSFVIDHEVRIALDHSERLVSKDVGNLK